MIKCVITEYILSQLDENQWECSAGISDTDVSKDIWLNYKLEVSFTCVDYEENHKFKVGLLMQNGLCLWAGNRISVLKLCKSYLLKAVGPSMADCVHNLTQATFSRILLFLCLLLQLKPPVSIFLLQHLSIMKMEKEKELPTDCLGSSALLKQLCHCMNETSIQVRTCIYSL